jgi:hypothetical protein
MPRGQRGSASWRGRIERARRRSVYAARGTVRQRVRVQASLPTMVRSACSLTDPARGGEAAGAPIRVLESPELPLDGSA